MSSDSVENVLSNPELTQQIATAFSGVTASNVVQVAAENPQFKAALSEALQAATSYGISFTPQSAASLLAAAEQAGATAAALAKFNQHKDNPTQIPLGTPIALVFISAALLFLPTILSTAGVTAFGGGAESGAP